MITPEEYFRKPHSDAQYANAVELLDRVHLLVRSAQENSSFQLLQDPDTRCSISGTAGGDGDGGFRSPGTRTGGSASSHREAKAVDVYDPGNHLDTWITDAILEEFDLYREHPDDTPGWCHLTTRRPKSGLRTFKP